MLRSLHGVAQRRIKAGLIGVADVVQVGKEHHVEQATLAGPSNVLVQLGPSPCIGFPLRQRMSPHGMAVIGGPMNEKLGKMHMIVLRHLHDPI